MAAVIVPGRLMHIGPLPPKPFKQNRGALGVDGMLMHADPVQFVSMAGDRESENCRTVRCNAEL